MHLAVLNYDAIKGLTVDNDDVTESTEETERRNVAGDVTESDKCQVFWMTARGVTPRRLYCSIK